MTIDVAVRLSMLMAGRLVANVAPGSLGVTGGESSEGEADGGEMLQVD